MERNEILSQLIKKYYTLSNNYLKTSRSKMLYNTDAAKEDAELAKEYANITRFLTELKHFWNNPSGWIPCEEFLPADEEEVLITYKAKGKEFVNIGFYAECYWYIYSNDEKPTFIDGRMVTAWQPLPEGYKGGTDAEKA